MGVELDTFPDPGSLDLFGNRVPGRLQPVEVSPRKEWAHVGDASAVMGALRDAPPVPCLSIAPGRVFQYDIPATWYANGRPGGGASGPRVDIFGDPLPTKFDPVEASRRSARNALDAAGWLWLGSSTRYVEVPGKRIPFRIAMWTLTVPAPMDERDVRAALSEWWTWARNVCKVQRYLWVAELTKRGRCHVHALVCEWIGVDQARRAWFRALKRNGLQYDGDDPPGALVHVTNCANANKAAGYVRKYIGKDFGDRAAQLVHRLRLCGTDDGAPEDGRVELRARLCEALQFPRALQRRWGASQGIERKPVQCIGVDDPRLYDAVTRELSAMPGVRWAEPTEHGRAAFFDTDAVVDHCPVLAQVLRDAATFAACTRSKARMHAGA